LGAVNPHIYARVPLLAKVGRLLSRVTRYDPISLWDIDIGDRYGRSDISEISIGDMG
jgi:hypothetical protein